MSLAVVAIVGIITVIGYLRDNSDKLKEVWDKVWNFIKNLFETVSTFIQELYTSNFAWILPAGPLVKAILFVKDNWETVWNGIKDIFDTVSTALTIHMGYVVGLAPYYGVVYTLEAVQTGWDTIWNAIKTAWATVSGAIKATWTTSWGWLRIAFSAAVKAVQLVWDPTWDAIKVTFSTVAGALTTAYVTRLGAGSKLDFPAPSKPCR